MEFKERFEEEKFDPEEDKDIKALEQQMMKDIEYEIARRRFRLVTDLIDTMSRTLQYSSNVVNAIGDISVDEAVNSIKEFFNREIERIR